MEPMLTKLSWDWLDIWFLGFLALQVSKETRSGKAWEHSNILWTSQREDLQVLQVKSDSKFLAWLFIFKRLLKVKVEIPYENFKHRNLRPTQLITIFKKSLQISNQI